MFPISKVMPTFVEIWENVEKVGKSFIFSTKITYNLALFLTFPSFFFLNTGVFFSFSAALIL